MHELSLCSALAEIVRRRAEQRRVQVIHLRIGQLRQVVPETLEFCWQMVSAETGLEGSVLQIEHVPAVLHCRACGAQHAMGDEVAFACRSCGGLDVEAVSGEEFVVTALDLQAA